MILHVLVMILHMKIMILNMLVIILLELEKILNIVDYNDRISPIKWDYSKNILGFRNLPLNLLAYFNMYY